MLCPCTPGFPGTLCPCAPGSPTSYFLPGADICSWEEWTFWALCCAKTQKKYLPPERMTVRNVKTLALPAPYKVRKKKNKRKHTHKVKKQSVSKGSYVIGPLLGLAICNLGWCYLAFKLSFNLNNTLHPSNCRFFSAFSPRSLPDTSRVSAGLDPSSIVVIFPGQRSQSLFIVFRSPSSHALGGNRAMADG